MSSKFEIPVVADIEEEAGQRLFSEETAVLGRVEDGDSSRGAETGVDPAPDPAPVPDSGASRGPLTVLDDILLLRADRGVGGKAALGELELVVWADSMGPNCYERYVKDTDGWRVIFKKEHGSTSLLFIL